VAVARRVAVGDLDSAAVAVAVAVAVAAVVRSSDASEVETLARMWSGCM
jgi:hypothetical protein